MLLHSALPTLGFGRLGTKAAPSHNLPSPFDSCHAKLGNTLGEPWMSCVVEMLLAKQEAAQQAGTDYFPIAAHSYDPFKQSSGSSSESESLKNKMRDYSCDVADGGSQPLRTTSWEYETPDPCSAGGAAQMGEFIYKSNRFLPAGNDIPGLGGGGQMSVEQAEAACAAEPRCQGFTFSAARWSDSPAARRQKQHSVSFKSEGDDSAAGEGWHTFKRRKAPLDCGDGGGGGRDEREVKKLRVHVLRESPPVYIVDDFLTASECDYMLNYTLPKMGPSVVIGGSTSSWRQSFSVNMYPDYDDESHVITRVARRKFAFARDFVGYTDVHENEGQARGRECNGSERNGTPLVPGAGECNGCECAGG